MPSEYLKDFWGNHINIQVDEKDFDFGKAKDIAKKKQKNWPKILCCYHGITEKLENITLHTSAVPGTSRYGLYLRNQELRILPSILMMGNTYFFINGDGVEFRRFFFQLFVAIKLYATSSQNRCARCLASYHMQRCRATEHF